MVEDQYEDQFGGLDDVYELSGEDPRFRDVEAEEEREEEDEDDETDDGDDDADDDLMWFDGHEGVSGDFTKTFKAEIAGNRPNSAATQANVLMARAKRQAGDANGKLDKQEILRKFQPSSVRNAKAERRICTQSLNEKRLQQLSDSMHKGVFGGAGGDKAARARGAKDKADRATTEQVLDPRTRLVLYKLLNKETLNSIHGCVSTGKEANVYYATTPTSFLDANNVAVRSRVILSMKKDEK
jgi:RIO kinase 1